MGLKDFFIRREANGFEKEHEMQWQQIKDWLNAEPGRKRGIGAVLLGLGAALNSLGHPQAAQGAELANEIIQGLSATSSISGVVMAGWGWLQAHKQGRA